MKETKSQPNFEPSGFFALRTPLLPIEEWLAWSDRLAAPQAGSARLKHQSRHRLRPTKGRRITNQGELL